MNRRHFLIKGMIASGAVWVFNGRSFGAVQHRYKLAPESILPEGLENAPIEIREAYRFAVANRDILRYSRVTVVVERTATRAMRLVT
jgi:hypothetical protein